MVAPATAVASPAAAGGLRGAPTIVPWASRGNAGVWISVAPGSIRGNAAAMVGASDVCHRGGVPGSRRSAGIVGFAGSDNAAAGAPGDAVSRGAGLGLSLGLLSMGRFADFMNKQ